MTIQEKIKQIEIALDKVHPLPWEFSGNYPFSVSMNKPRPSLSKHDHFCHALWHWEDGNYAAMCVNLMPELLAYIKTLEEVQFQNKSAE